MRVPPSLFLLLSILCLAPGASPQRKAVAAHRQTAELKQDIVGYFPQWGVYNRRYVPLDLVRSGAIRVLTQLDYSQANIHDSSCVLADPQADINLAFKAEDSVDGKADDPAATASLRGNFHQLQLLRKQFPQLRVLVSIEGRRDLFEEAAKPENRVAFVHSCVARFLQGHIAPGVEAPGLFDGIDVDWEYPDASHAADFYALMVEFRRQMDLVHPASTAVRAGAARHGFTLSIASGASHKNIDPIDWARVAKSVDQIGVMTYDFNGPWSRDTGFNAPLRASDPHAETVSSVIDAYIAAGVPPKQLLLGVPFYAYQWHNVVAGNHFGLNSQGDPMRGNLNQSTAVTLMQGPAAQLHRDPLSSAPWIYDGDNFLTFEDAVSLKAKSGFAQSRHLGGIMIWELSGDTNDAQLLRSLRRN